MRPLKLAATAAAATLTIGLTTAAGEPAAPPGDATSCADSVFNSMSLSKRVGQLFMVAVSSTKPTTTQLEIVKDRHLGGAIMMGHTDQGVAATRKVADQVQAQATSTNGARLLLSTDQEGGNVQVFKGPGFSTMPTALDQGKQPTATLRSNAAKWGNELRAAGLNMNLAPVMDTVPKSMGTKNKPIGYYYREYGQTPDVVSEKGNAFADGMRDAGMQATAKHFPGLGRVKDNTDTTFGVTDHVTTRHDDYIKPFADAAANGIPAIMMSSAKYDKIDSHHRAVFSPTIMHDMLRGDLKFRGIIISDALGAEALKDVTPEQRAIKFLEAGGTIGLDASAGNVAKMIDAVRDRANSDADFKSKVDAAARIVLQTKDKAGLLKCSA